MTLSNFKTERLFNELIKFEFGFSEWDDATTDLICNDLISAYDYEIYLIDLINLAQAEISTNLLFITDRLSREAYLKRLWNQAWKINDKLYDLAIELDNRNFFGSTNSINITDYSDFIYVGINVKFNSLELESKLNFDEGADTIIGFYDSKFSINLEMLRFVFMLSECDKIDLGLGHGSTFTAYMIMHYQNRQLPENWKSISHDIDNFEPSIEPSIKSKTVRKTKGEVGKKTLADYWELGAVDFEETIKKLCDKSSKLNLIYAIKHDDNSLSWQANKEHLRGFISVCRSLGRINLNVGEKTRLMLNNTFKNIDIPSGSAGEYNLSTASGVKGEILSDFVTTLHFKKT